MSSIDGAFASDSNLEDNPEAEVDGGRVTRNDGDDGNGSDRLHSDDPDYDDHDERDTHIDKQVSITASQSNISLCLLFLHPQC